MPVSSARCDRLALERQCPLPGTGVKPCCKHVRQGLVPWAPGIPTGLRGNARALTGHAAAAGPGLQQVPPPAAGARQPARRAALRRAGAHECPGAAGRARATWRHVGFRLVLSPRREGRAPGGGGCGSPAGFGAAGMLVPGRRRSGGRLWMAQANIPFGATSAVPGFPAAPARGRPPRPCCWCCAWRPGRCCWRPGVCLGPRGRCGFHASSCRRLTTGGRLCMRAVRVRQALSGIF